MHRGNGKPFVGGGKSDAGVARRLGVVNDELGAIRGPAAGDEWVE
ncbi:hypothetical protein [Nibrella viscosa]